MDSLGQVLVDFQEYVHKISSLDIFHTLMLSVLQISNKVKKENLSPQLRDWIDEILGATKVAKRLFSSDLSNLHKLLSRLVAEVGINTSDPEEARERIRRLSEWVVGVQVDIEKEKSENKLVDYMKELEELKGKFRELDEVTKKVGSRNEQLRRSEEELEQLLEAEKKRADKMSHKAEKTAKAYEELRAKYGQLFEKFNQLTLEVRV